MLYGIQIFKRCLAATKKEFYDSLHTVTEITFDDSKKVKGNGITIHPLTMTYADGKTSTGVLFKRSGFGGHHLREEDASFFGHCSYKMVTEVILQIGNNDPMKCAMSTEERFCDPWQGDEHLNIQKEILQNPHSIINDRLIVPIPATKNGWVHQDIKHDNRG